MATILPFRRLAPQTARREPAPAGGAAIVIFPGVRYERRDGDGGRGGTPGLRQERKQRTKR